MKAKRDNSLKNKFRFVVLNDETFEEKFSLTLTRWNVWVFMSTVVVVLVVLTASAIIYTPLKYFIPGFGDFNYRSQLVALTFKTDSLATALAEREQWLENFSNVISGKADTMKPAVAVALKPSEKEIGSIATPTEEELKLRSDVEKEESFSLNYKDKKDNVQIKLNEFHFFPPVEGIVTDEFDPAKNHYGIDIAAPLDASVKATLEGTVISTGWNFETGYNIVIQHKDNLITFYKHNSKLFKSVGSPVKAGEVIANVGSTGILSSGPHLHFELWHNGLPLNPRDYMILK